MENQTVAEAIDESPPMANAGAPSRDYYCFQTRCRWRRTDKLNISKQILFRLGCVLPSFWNLVVNVVSLPKGDCVHSNLVITGMVKNVNIFFSSNTNISELSTNKFYGIQDQCTFQDLFPREDIDKGWDLHPALDSMSIVPVEI